MKTTLSLEKLTVDDIALANGSQLYFKKFEEAPRVAMSIYIHGGNRVESKPGLADMVDDLLMEGTEKRSSEQIAVELDDLSLDLDTDTRRDYSIMSATFLEEDLEASLEMMSDLLFQSTLNDFEKEKIRLQGELIMDLDSPRSRSHDLMMTTLFQDTPYQGSHSNILQTIPTITGKDVLTEHYRNIHHPGNLLFSVVGNIDRAELQKQIERYFVRTDSDTRTWANTNPPQQAKLAKNQYVTAAKDDSNQMHIFKGWFAPHITHPDYPAMVLLNTILGGAGLTSRLFLELRDKQGLAYNVRSQYEASKFLGLFYLYIGTEPNNREKALKGFEVECQKLVDHLVGPQELEEAKENVLGRRVVFLETAAQQCSYIGNQIVLGVPLDQLNVIPEQVQAVTAQDVQRVAQTYFTQPSITSAVGPSKNL